MCGIAGFLAENPDPALLQSMCDQLRHRGPDDCGYWTGGQVALGHRRLSIIDIAGGRQPLSNEDGAVWITFNGEIYNYLELRRRLLAAGHTFKTQCDTEVLVHLYEDVGEQLPEHLRGMFAFAIWDARRSELFLARDRFGEKPLYYSTDIPGFKFCFASELKALAVVPGFDQRIDFSALADYLALSYVPDPKSINAGVHKLPPGHTLTVSSRGIRLRRYWQPPFSEAKQSGFQQAADELRTLAQDAVRGQTMSAVPLGVLLSGGVDSSAVVGILSKQISDPVRTFSIGFTEETHNELPYARMVAERSRTRHHERTLSAAIEEVLPALTWHFDEPFADSSAIPALYVARIAREQVTVALTGDGADEVFAGYRKYFNGMLESRLRSFLPRGLRSRAWRHYPEYERDRPWLRARAFAANAACAPADALFNAVSAFRDSNLEAVLAPEIRARIKGYNPRQIYREKCALVQHLHPLDQMQWVDMTTSLPGDMLVKMDRAAMAHSLENRSPWLDHRLAELAGSLPTNFKLHGLERKYIWKAAVSQFVPEAILERRKMGFQAPLAKWFRTSLRPVFQEAVLAPGGSEYFDPGVVGRMWNEHQSGAYDHGRKLWTLLVFILWTRQWLRDRPVSP